MPAANYMPYLTRCMPANPDPPMYAPILRLPAEPDPPSVCLDVPPLIAKNIHPYAWLVVVAGTGMGKVTAMAWPGS